MQVAWPMSPTVVQLHDTCRQGEREEHYISSSHLGLIRCLTPCGGSVIRYMPRHPTGTEDD